MKKKRIAQSAFFNLRTSIGLLVCGVTGCSLLTGTGLAFFRAEAQSKLSYRTLTFQDRVAYQRAIEEVYWRHRIWPRERPDPKPSLDAVMSHAQLENKVADYLGDSEALEDCWRQPITAKQLQVEMDRMAQHSKQPELLRELFAALGHDPLVVAECLVRPVLAERLVTNFSGFEREQLKSWRARAETRLMAGARTDYTLPAIQDGSNGCIDDTWTATSITNAPSDRLHHTAVWTGSEMIIWGGFNGSQLNTGGRYNPSTDSWTATSTTSAPSGRELHTAVWAGSEMIVWGGTNDNTGGRYNPATDTWTATSTTNAPFARRSHTAVWTGSEMIIWGGETESGPTNTGGVYNPGTNSWVPMSITNAPPARTSHTAVWTGSEMVVWGGCCPAENTGGRYNPSTDSWTGTSLTNAPAARYEHTAVWTGSEMIVWGGWDGPNIFDTGGRYNPSTDSWTTISTINAPIARYAHTAVWSGNEMIIWGGGYLARNDCMFFNTDGRDQTEFAAATPTPTPTATATASPTPSFGTGGRYNPDADSWRATSTTNAPAARILHTAVWTNSEMIVWGGVAPFATNTGGRYCAQFTPPTPTPTPTPTATLTPRLTPAPRVRPTPAPRP